nr:FAD-dependent oxidoreductase [Thermus scotoductus]
MLTALRIFFPFILSLGLTYAQYDLVVYGATPQGVTAAVAAAQEGLKVLLLEPGRGVGGVLGGSPRSLRGLRSGSGGRRVRHRAPGPSRSALSLRAHPGRQSCGRR